MRNQSCKAISNGGQLRVRWRPVRVQRIGERVGSMYIMKQTNTEERELKRES